MTSRIVIAWGLGPTLEAALLVDGASQTLREQRNDINNDTNNDNDANTNNTNNDKQIAPPRWRCRM